MPPRAWIESTLRFDKPERVGALLPDVIADIDPPSSIVEQLEAQGAFPSSEDKRLAQRIVDGAPQYFYGDNGLNRYAHGAWALTVLNRDQEAWELIKRVGPVAPRMRIPIGVLKMYTFVALRRRYAHGALVGTNSLSKWHRPFGDPDMKPLIEACMWLLQDMATLREASV